MTRMATPRAPWTVGSTPPTLPLQRGGKQRPFFLGSLVSPSFCQRITEPLQSSTLVPDPRLQTSRTGSDRGSSQGKDPGSLLFPSHMPQKSSLDSCFRRNDREGAGMTEGERFCGVSPPHDEGKNAGFRPPAPRSFCFGKRTQNHGRPGVALRVPLPQSRRLGLRNSLRSDSPRPFPLCHPGLDPGSSVFSFSFLHATKIMTGFLLSQE